MFRSIVLLLLLCFIGIDTKAQEKQEAMKLALFVEKLDYYVIQPITLKSILYNNLDKNLKISFYSPTILYRKIGDNEFTSYSRGYLTDGMMATNLVDFNPHDEILREHYLLYNGKRKQFVLDSAGVYELKIVFENKASRVQPR